MDAQFYRQGGAVAEGRRAGYSVDSIYLVAQTGDVHYAENNMAGKTPMANCRLYIAGEHAILYISDVRFASKFVHGFNEFRLENGIVVTLHPNQCNKGTGHAMINSVFYERYRVSMLAHDRAIVEFPSGSIQCDHEYFDYYMKKFATDLQAKLSG